MKSQDKDFYIGLSIDDEDQSVSALLLHALKQLKRDIKGQEIVIEQLHLVNGYGDDDMPSIYLRYSLMTRQDKELRQANIEFAKELKVAKPVKLLAFDVPHRKGLRINRFIQRLEDGPGQDDSIRLVEEVARTLRELGDVTVYDLLLHEFCDADGLDRPYISVYYAS